MRKFTYFIPWVQTGNCVSQNWDLEREKKNEGVWIGKIEIWTRKIFSAVGETHVWIFSEIFVSSWFSAEGTLFSAFAVPHWWWCNPKMHPQQHPQRASCKMLHLYFNKMGRKKQNMFYSNSSHEMYTGGSSAFSKKQWVVYAWLRCSRERTVIRTGTRNTISPYRRDFRLFVV